MTVNEKKLSTLSDELVPASGPADTLAGEIVRAMERIAYRNWNDGDHLGVGYGKETCNPAGRFLAEKCGKEIESLVMAAWGISDDTAYDMLLDVLESGVLKYLETHPELKTMPNTEDLFDYRDEDEDSDDGWDWD